MIDTIFYLASCDTCRKIIRTLPKGVNLAYHDIKQDPITIEEQLDEMAGSYEALFSKKKHNCIQINGTEDKNLGEDDYKKYILEHYTFLSRPVL
jgi:arsenate reductase